MKVNVKDKLSAEELDEILAGLKKEKDKEEEEYKPKALNIKITEDLYFLKSCTVPHGDEKAVVTDYKYKNRSTKFPMLKEKPLDIVYMVNGLMRTVGYDFKTLEMSVDSNLARKRVIENAGITYDNEAKLFLEDHVCSSNSPRALSILLGYDLLAPKIVKKVEETNKTDDMHRRIVKVHTLDFLEKQTPLIIGKGIGISKYLDCVYRIEVIN